MAACAGEIGRIAPAHGVNVHTVSAWRDALEVVHNLHESAVGDLILVEFHGARDLLARHFGGRLLNDVLIDRHTARRSTGRGRAATTASLSAATSTSARRRRLRLGLCGDECRCCTDYESNPDRLGVSHTGYLSMTPQAMGVPPLTPEPDGPGT